MFEVRIVMVYLHNGGGPFKVIQLTDLYSPAKPVLVKDYVISFKIEGLQQDSNVSEQFHSWLVAEIHCKNVVYIS